MSCCYARSDKYWIIDPQGVAWETYHTLGEAEIYGAQTKTAGAVACCDGKPETTEAQPRAGTKTCC